MENSRSIIPSSMRFFRYTLVLEVSSISDFILISFSFVFPRATASIMEFINRRFAQLLPQQKFYLAVKSAAL